MKAAARYLRLLREKQVGSREKLKERMHLSDDSILERIETASNEPKILNYFAFIRAVGARADHVAALLSGGDDAAAQAAADVFYEEIISGGDASSDDRARRRATAVAIAEQLAAHPESFGRWIERGEQILDDLVGKS